MLDPLKLLSQNMHTAFLAPPFLASVLFVTAKYCQTNYATSLFSGCSRFALSMSSSLIMWKKIEIKNNQNRKTIPLNCNLSEWNPFILIAKSPFFPLYYTELEEISDLAIYRATRASRLGRFWATRASSAQAPRPTLHPWARESQDPARARAHRRWR